VLPGYGIFLTGWAVDAPARAPASAVYISVDGDRRSPVPARYGRAMSLPPAVFGPGRWTNCGFTALVPTDTLEPGFHTIEPLVVASNSFGYYVPSIRTFEIIADQDESEET
jgi:hypothetical protein